VQQERYGTAFARHDAADVGGVGGTKSTRLYRTINPNRSPPPPRTPPEKTAALLSKFCMEAACLLRTSSLSRWEAGG
jgi:hypothetical protein